MAKQMQPQDKTQPVKEDEILSGKRFGLLSLHGRDRTKINGIYWLCVCDCGNVRSVRTEDLRSGKVGFCGDANKHSRRYENIILKRGDIRAKHTGD